MNTLTSIPKLIGVALAITFVVGCVAPTTPPPAPRQLNTPIPPPLQPDATPPEQTTQATQTTVQSLVSDFIPCSGAPSGQTTRPGADRALMAYSNNGLDFHRPANPKDGVLLDRISVPDAVMLPSGRLLVYFVDGCRPPEIVERLGSTMIVAVSDQQGISGSWVYKNVRFLNLPPQYNLTMVDPNVTLLPDGSLRLMATMFWKEAGTEKRGAFSFSSNDGGFTYSYLGLSYAGILDPENYRFTDTNWQIITGDTDVPGYAMSIDGGSIFSAFGSFPVHPGVVHEITATEEDEQYRAYATTPTGIQSFLAKSAPWTTWIQEPGYRLQLDSTTGLESCEVRFPTVLKLGTGRYLMIYETVIPGCGCEGNPICP